MSYLTDIITTSPLERGELSNTTAVDIPKPHNVHTTIGVRWRF